MKTVIITGASGNLGKTTVEKFLATGHRVVATFSPGKPSPFEKRDGLETYAVDLTDEKSVADTLATIFSKYPVVDGALLLAGAYGGGSLKDTDSTALSKMMAVNFNTAYFAARPLLLQMQKQHNGGRIVLVGSRTALRAADAKNSLAYALSKSLLFNLAEYLNAEGAKQNVVTSIIAPSTIDTPDNRKAMPNADFSSWVSTGEIAETLLFIINSPSLREPVFKLYGKA
jgi:NAD(P)-dependent dehydrogenase (short-subunit alcohol dehydrogenase family)